MSYIGGKKHILIIQAVIFSVVFFVSSTHSTAQALLQTGAQAPDFSLTDTDGNEVSLSQYSGKKAVAIFFWSTWSEKSRNGLKRFDEFYRKYREKGIQVIGINTDNQTISAEDIGNIKKTVMDSGVTYPVLLDKGLRIFHEYSVIALPSTIVISEGKISYELPGLPLVGTEDMFDYLLMLAGETPRKKIEPKFRPSHDAIADTNLARKFVKKEKYAMAYPLFKKAIEKEPKYLLPYVELAKLYELDGNNTEAEDTFRKALAAEPENVVVMSELGYFLSKSGKIKEALEILDAAVKKNSYTPSHYYYAYALAKAGQTKESLTAFDKAVELNPFEQKIYSLRAETYENSNMLKEASADYRKALELILRIN